MNEWQRVYRGRSLKNSTVRIIAERSLNGLLRSDALSEYFYFRGFAHEERAKMNAVNDVGGRCLFLAGWLAGWLPIARRRSSVVYRPFLSKLRRRRRSFVPKFVRSFRSSFRSSFVRFASKFVPMFIRSFRSPFVPLFVRSEVRSFRSSFVPKFVPSEVRSFLR